MNNPFEEFMMGFSNANQSEYWKKQYSFDETHDYYPELNNELKSDFEKKDTDCTDVPASNPLIDIVFRALIGAIPDIDNSFKLKDMILYFMDHKVPVHVIMEGVQILIGVNKDESNKD